MPLPPNSHTNGVNFFFLDVFTLLPNRSNAQLLTRLIKKHTCPLPSHDPPPCSSRRPPLHPMRRGVGRAEGWPAGSESRGGWLGAQASRVATASGDRGPRRPAGSESSGGRLGAWGVEGCGDRRRARGAVAHSEPGHRGRGGLQGRRAPWAAVASGERQLRRPARSLGVEARRPVGTEGARMQADGTEGVRRE